MFDVQRVWAAWLPVDCKQALRRWSWLSLQNVGYWLLGSQAVLGRALPRSWKPLQPLTWDFSSASSALATLTCLGFL